ncbi:MAG: hypothetical protein L0227_06100, partial [Chloroflexi bacterium]|nr:hypothetical protein [Chloroflexota bacterium]
MTLPFRRRHHDSESGHDRARALISDELQAQLGSDDTAWLARHLDACAECRRDQEAYRADRDLLRGLRDTTPEPPRDLWARTAAALEREARRRHGGAARRVEPTARSRWRGFPLGAAAAALIVVVVLGTTFVPQPTPPTATAGQSAVAVTTPIVGPTPIAVAAKPVGILREAPDGSWELVFSRVDEVCPPSDPSCVPKLGTGPEKKVDLGKRPSTVTLSPTAQSLVVESAGDETTASAILVVPVEPGPTVTQEPTVTPSSVPGSGEPPSPAPGSPVPTPAGAIAIATGVMVVGDVAYSEDGRWLAFSAAPSDGSTGPDLYLWSVGEASATAVTSDHLTYFSA